MIPVLSRLQIQALDQSLIERARVPGLILMENAGRNAAATILDAYRARAERILVVCGTGNNGGDGFVVARHLTSAGKRVEVALLGRCERLKGDALSMAEAWRGIGGTAHCVGDIDELPALRQRLGHCDLVVDAIFGTGLSKPLSGLQLEAVRSINESGVPCCALDIPSGIDADTGEILGDAPHAQLTVTFAHPKLGQFSKVAVERMGRLVVASLGVPEESWERVGASAHWLMPEDVLRWMPRRSPTVHKGNTGRVAIVAGSPGTFGAALLAARGALRAGAGLVTHVGYRSTIDALQGRLVEAMSCSVEQADLRRQVDDCLRNMDSVVLGPGLGLDEKAAELVRITLELAKCPVIIDADALTLVAANPNWLTHSPGPRILTPHAGEFARILACEVQSIEQNRFDALSRAVSMTRCVVVAKGPYTLVGSPERLPIVVGGPCSTLATGGSGDVLSGVIGALAVSADPVRASVCGVVWHQAAATRWQRVKEVDRGLLAHEIADSLPDALAELSRNHGRVSD